MRNMRGAEEDVTPANCGHLLLNPVTAGAGGDEIKLVAVMRNLWAIRGSSSEPYFEISVDENLRRSPRRPRQGEGCGKQYWRRCAIHQDSLLGEASHPSMILAEAIPA